MSGAIVRKVSFDAANAKIRALGEVLRRPMQDVLESAGRVVATQCARTAQPFGTGADALQAGRTAVARDISKVYATPGRAYKDISNPHWRAVFWKAIKAGEDDVAQEILAKFGSNLRGVRVDRFDGGSAHKQARDPRSGRVRSNQPVMVVTDPDKLKRHLEDRQKNVGFGKGGFADIARALGRAPRGLREEGDITAGWITRHRGFGKFSLGGTPEHQTITITNTVPYADQILNGGALSEAKRIGRERMIENLRIAVEAEARKLRSAA